MRAALTRKMKAWKAAEDPDKKATGDRLLEECARAEGVFSRKGYPDSWHDWERARDEVRMFYAFSSRG